MEGQTFYALILFVLCIIVFVIGVISLDKAREMTFYTRFSPTEYKEIDTIAKLGKLCGPYGWGRDILNSKLSSGRINCGKSCRQKFIKKYREIPIYAAKSMLDKSIFCENGNCPETQRCISLATLDPDEDIEKSLEKSAISCALLCDWIMRRDEVCASQSAEVWDSGGGGFSSPCTIRRERLP